jgi:hypothetical protein
MAEALAGAVVQPMRPDPGSKKILRIRLTDDQRILITVHLLAGGEFIAIGGMMR